MAPPEYTDVDEMRGRLGQDAGSGRLQLAISAGARQIFEHTGRVFTLDEEPSKRRFRVRGNTVLDPEGELLLVDDIGDDDTLEVEIGDGFTWTAYTGKLLAEPLNALKDHWPITGLRIPYSRWLGPYVQVNTRWGWPDTPATVSDANRILAERWYRRKDAPWGVAGFGESGLARLAESDPDVALQLGEFVRFGA